MPVVPRTQPSRLHATTTVPPPFPHPHPPTRPHHTPAPTALSAAVAGMHSRPPSHQQHRVQHIGQRATPHAHHAARLLQADRHQRLQHRMAHAAARDAEPAAGGEAVGSGAAAQRLRGLFVDHQARPLSRKHLLVHKLCQLAAWCTAAGGCRCPRRRPAAPSSHRGALPAASGTTGAAAADAGVPVQRGVGPSPPRGRGAAASGLGARYDVGREVAGVGDGRHAGAQAQRPQHLSGTGAQAHNLVTGCVAAGGAREQAPHVQTQAALPSRNPRRKARPLQSNAPQCWPCLWETERACPTDLQARSA